jgi:Skp family chaperone for outer membrane proteins
VLNVKSYLSLATLVATAICFSASALQSQQPGAPRPAGTSVAVIDINYIFKNHERFKRAMDDIKKEIEAYETHLRDERTKITQKAEQLKNLAASSPQYKQLEEEIASLHTQLQLETGRKRTEVLDKEARLYFHAYQEVEENVKMFANRYGIGLVLRYSGEAIDPSKRDSVLAGVNRAVVFQQNLDITNDILGVLNRGTPPANNRTTTPQIPGRPPMSR